MSVHTLTKQHICLCYKWYYRCNKNNLKQLLHFFTLKYIKSDDLFNINLISQNNTGLTETKKLCLNRHFSHTNSTMFIMM